MITTTSGKSKEYVLPFFNDGESVLTMSAPTGSDSSEDVCLETCKKACYRASKGLSDKNQLKIKGGCCDEPIL